LFGKNYRQALEFPTPSDISQPYQQKPITDRLTAGIIIPSDKLPCWVTLWR